VRPVGAADHILGNPTAPVTIITYTDFNCEYCKEFDETMRRIIASEGTGGEVAWIYRQFPLSEIHPDALRHAEAAECIAQAAGNAAFWDFAKQLFENQPASTAEYGTYAERIGVSNDAFASCSASVPKEIDEHIQADRQNALLMGARGTPYSLIIVAGKPPVVMAGAYPYGAVKELIDEALAGVK
jgi:protein-disulfide isomerase